MESYLAEVCSGADESRSIEQMNVQVRLGLVT